MMRGVLLRGSGQSGKYVELHEDQARAVRMLLGDEEPTPWLVFYLRERKGTNAVLATAAWKLRKRSEAARAGRRGLGPAPAAAEVAE